MSKFKVYEYMVGMQGTFVNMANGHRAQPGQYVAYGDYLILLAERDGLQETADMRLEQLQTHIKRIAVVNRENDLLKAQVEELKYIDVIAANVSTGKSVVMYLAENVRLKAEVERLRKAGDAMADWFTHNDCRECRNDCQGWLPKAWNTAKEGKQS